MIEEFIKPEMQGPYLTKTEALLVRLIADGYTNSEIAAIRERSEQTIKNQVYVIYQRFNVHSAIQLLNKLGMIAKRSNGGKQ